MTRCPRRRRQWTPSTVQVTWAIEIQTENHHGRPVRRVHPDQEPSTNFAATCLRESIRGATHG